MSSGRTVDVGTEQLLGSVSDGVAVVTYNNPARHNALSMEMIRAVPPMLEALQADPEVAVIVITGAGDKAFVSGADISEFGEKRTSVDARAEYDRALGGSMGAWAHVDKPIIAMIRGYCMGGGLITALKADIRIAAEGSQFAIPAARLGLGYAFGGVEQLVSLVGPSWASEILFSARRLSAAEALHIGLVNRVVPGAELETSVRELAASIAANAPLTVRACKLAIREAQRDPAARDLGAVQQLIEACFRSEDYREGQQAFLEKRPPRFRGH